MQPVCLGAITKYRLKKRMGFVWLLRCGLSKTLIDGMGHVLKTVPEEQDNQVSVTSEPLHLGQ